MNFYKLYPGDYARDTGHLSHAEHGAYFLMLNAYYGAGKPLPSEPERLYRLLHATTETEQASVDYVLSQFWRRTPEGWVNGRAEVELAKAEAAAEVSRANGRKRKPGGIPAGIPSSIPDGIQPDTRYQIPENQIPEPEREEAARAREAVPPDHFHAQYDPAFKTFMKELQATYPEHVGRSNWRKAEEGVVALLNDGYTHDRIRGAVMRKRAFHEAKGDLGTEFVTNPGNFFADPENIDNLWRPPAQQQRKTRKEEAAEHNWQTLQALRRGADEAGGPGRVQQGDSGGGGVSRPQIASNGS